MGRDGKELWRDPLSPAAVEENLRDAGCPCAFVEKFLQCYGDCTPAEQLRLLERQRQALLDQIHESQKKLDCLDYLRYQIKKSKDGGK